MRTQTIGLIVTLVLAASASAQDTPADWIRKLGSGSYLERERAAKMLEQKGKAALPWLRDAIANADLETRRRAILLMERIEDRALLDDLVTPTPTRLRFQDIDINDALRSIEPQIGLRCSSVTAKTRIERIDTGELPYWQAWAKFCKDAHLAEGDYGRSAAKLIAMRDGVDEQAKFLLTRSEFDNSKFDSPRIELSAQADNLRYVVDDRHSVRVRVRWLMTDHKIDKSMAHAVFAFELRGEPRLEINGAPRVELTKIVDDMGNEKAVQTARMLPELISPADANILSAFAGEVQYGGLLHLKAIPWPHAAGKLRAMYGNVRLEAIVRPSLLEVAQMAKSLNKTTRGYDGTTVKVLEFDTSDDVVVRLHVDNLASFAPQTPDQKFIRVRPGVLAERGAIDVAMERFELLDARGHKYRRVKSNYQQVKDGKGYEVELHFAAKADKDEPTLVLTKAARAIAFNVPFVVRDLAWDEASRRP